MLFRQAMVEDYDNVIAMYRAIIEENVNDNAAKWDATYPMCRVAEDIARGDLYVMTEGEEVLSAIVLTEDCGENDQAIDTSDWHDRSARARYVFRFGVNPRHLRRGIASKTLHFAVGELKERGYDYIRLYVMRDNEIASKVYEKFGFSRVAGEHIEVVDGIELREVSYELKI